MPRIQQQTRTADHADARQIVLSFGQAPGEQRTIPAGVKVVVISGTYEENENGPVFHQFEERRIVIPYEDLSAGDKRSLSAVKARLLSIALDLEGIQTVEG